VDSMPLIVCAVAQMAIRVWRPDNGRTLVSFYLGQKSRPSLRVARVKMTPVLEQGQVSA